MAKQRTKVINRTGYSVNLTMATGGILSRESTKPVEDQDHYTISIDPNATYREYWCAVQPGNRDKVILSSDDCAEYSEVELVARNGKYEWTGTRKRDSKRAGPHHQANAGGQASSSPRQAPVVNAGGAHKSLSAKPRPSQCCTIL